MNNKFVDAQEMARTNPETFEVPCQKALEEVNPGDMVKVCAGGERFWVEVKCIVDEQIHAEVNNKLVCTNKHGYSLGDAVQLERKHIYDIWPAGATMVGAFCKDGDFLCTTCIKDNKSQPIIPILSTEEAEEDVCCQKCKKVLLNKAAV